MGITYDEKQRIFALQTRETTYLLGLADEAGYVGHIYYGKKLEGDGAGYLLRTQERPFVPSEYKREKLIFMDSFPMEYSVHGTGDFRESCLAVRNAQGYPGCELHFRHYEIQKGKPGLEGLPASFGNEDACETLTVYCEDPVLGLEAALRYTVFEDSDAIARSVELKNNSGQPIYLDKVLSACLDMDQEEFELITLHGGWAREAQIQRSPLLYGKHRMGSLRGETSHQEHPFLALVTPGTTQTTGEVYAMNFVYSGNFLAQAELSQYGSVRMVMGIHPEGFCWKLQPGETFTAPETVMVYSDAGLGKMTRTYHDFYRSHMIRSPYLHEKRPILINNWEATYFDFDSEKLVDIAKEAVKNGIEMLVMDDGWFGKRNADDCSLGDWWVNEEKLKGGLPLLVSRVKALGLKFGIWFEPEMVSPDSELYRAHPDWAIQLPGREGVQARQQFVLDFSRQEIIDHIYRQMADIIRESGIDYVKWDMNRALTDIGSACLEQDRQGELFHRYVLGVYQIQERLIRDFPSLLLENCSSGGARFDPGMLYYSPQIWCSDDTDALERLGIQEGISMIYPLSCIGAHVSDCPNHITGRSVPFETRGHVALAGTFGYELDITRIPEADRAMIRGQTEMYHRYNDLVREGDYDRLASFRENHLYDAWQVTAKDQSEALVTWIQVLAKPDARSRKLKVRGLDPQARYLVKRESVMDQEQPSGFPEEGMILGGDMLMYAGLLVPPMKGDYRSCLFHLTRVEK